MISWNQMKIIEDAINVLLLFVVAVIDFSALLDQMQWLSLMLLVSRTVILLGGVKKSTTWAPTSMEVNPFSGYIHYYLVFQSR